jgi:hypothetical protein
LEQKQTKETKNQPEGLEPSLSSLPSVKNLNHWLFAICHRSARISPFKKTVNSVVISGFSG